MWRFVAARVQGSSHRRVGSPCQDQYSGETLSSGLVVAVADGAGSAANSEKGAEIAVQTTVAEARRALETGRSDFETLLRDAAICAREAVLAEAAREGSEARSYASTLLALVITPDGGAALQIGDGVIVVNDAEGQWGWVFWPQHGEYVNTTYFLTGEDAVERVRTSALEPHVSDFAMTTDGLEPLVLYYATKAVHAPFFDAMFRPLVRAETPEAVDRLSAALEAYLGSDQIASRTDDDLSLILATRRSLDLAP